MKKRHEISESVPVHVVQACVLSHFSSVWLCVILWTVACQAPLSMGFLGKNTGVHCPVSRGSCPLREWTLMFYISCIGSRVL